MSQPETGRAGETQARTSLRLIKPIVGDPTHLTFGFQVVLPDSRIVCERFGFATSAQALDAGAAQQKAHEAMEDTMARKAAKKGRKP